MNLHSHMRSFLIGILTTLIIGTLNFQSCQNPTSALEVLEEVNPSITIDFIRFDQFLQGDTTSPAVQHFAQLTEEFPAFANVYRRNVLEVRGEEELINEVEIMRTDTSFYNLYTTVQETFADSEDLETELAQALENYGNTFDIPQEQLPLIYGFISGFIYQAFVFEDQGKSGVGIGLDMFLSSDFPYTKILRNNPQFSAYLVRSYNQDQKFKFMTY